MEGYVRIGMLHDGKRFYELRMPLDMPCYDSKHHGTPSSFYALLEYDRQIAELVDKTKAQLKELLPDAEDLGEETVDRDHAKAYQKVRQGGIRLLLAFQRAAARLRRMAT
jgi:hypothetical protein